MSNHLVSKLLALSILAGIPLGSGCVVRTTPTHTVYRESHRAATVHDHRR